MDTKKNILILCGGQSTEHKISLISAKNVCNAIDTKLFNPILVAVDIDNQWHYNELDNLILNPLDPTKVSINDNSLIVQLTSEIFDGKLIFKIKNEINNIEQPVDLVLPIMHGNKVEDGILQGFLENIGIPYVGCRVLASAICMDKDVCRRLLKGGGINGVPTFVINSYDKIEEQIQAAKAYLGPIYPLYVKPANGGSSIGVYKVTNDLELNDAVLQAFKLDSKILIEQGFKVREIEVAILGNDELIISEPGEIVINTNYYDFESKYNNPNASRAVIPASIPTNIAEDIKSQAKKAYRLLGCNGLSRIDFFFIEETSEIYLNEVNTMPGFTSISMYPKLMENTGLNYTQLITKLINTGF